LLKRGHRDIVLLFQTKNNPERLQGYYDAMREARITDYEKRTFRMFEYTVGETNLLLKRICRQYPGFTAVVSCSDDDILRMIVSMRQQGIEWEGRKAMIGFGNLRGISNIYPIATVDQHPLRIGAEAYRLLLKKIADPDTVIQEYLDTELVNLQNIPVIS
ncbi:MAG: LacI family DNA-binding transcriptional regulator, partial [Lentisphaeria bacterium]|nr:LacI family DNA-binding transcriptional regulator [Lentisphaeria bacterium]